MKNKSLRTRYFILSFLITFSIITVLGFLTLFSSGTRDVAATGSGIPRDYIPSASHDITVLCIGEGKESRAYCLLNFSATDMRLSVISLPAEMMIGERTLSDTQSYGGAKYLSQSLSEKLGITVDRYIRLNANVFISLLDELGSVHVTTENDIFHTSEEDGDFSLTRGEHILPAEKIYQILRYDNVDGEIYRLNRQTTVIATVLSQKLNEEKVPDAQEFFNMVVNLIDTDITAFDFDTRILAAREFLKTGEITPIMISADEDMNLTPATLETIASAF